MPGAAPRRCCRVGRRAHMPHANRSGVRAGDDEATVTAGAHHCHCERLIVAAVHAKLGGPSPMERKIKALASARRGWSVLRWACDACRRAALEVPQNVRPADACPRDCTATHCPTRTVGACWVVLGFGVGFGLGEWWWWWWWWWRRRRRRRWCVCVLDTGLHFCINVSRGGECERFAMRTEPSAAAETAQSPP